MTITIYNEERDPVRRITINPENRVSDIAGLVREVSGLYDEHYVDSSGKYGVVRAKTPIFKINQ